MAQGIDIVHLRIGKSGLTEGIVEEARRQLGRTDPLVVKLLQNFRDSHDRKAAAQELAERTGSRVQDFVGGTVVLTRKRNS